MVPLIYSAITQANPEGATGVAAGALAIAGAITRVLALPIAETFLQRFLPWLAASALGDDDPMSLPSRTDVNKLRKPGSYRQD